MPELNSPKFAPIKARFARAYLEHKADLGVPNASDEAVLAAVDEITAILFASSVRAWRADDQRWKERYGWFAAITSELLDDLPGKPLDGRFTRDHCRCRGWPGSPGGPRDTRCAGEAVQRPRSRDRIDRPEYRGLAPVVRGEFGDWKRFQVLVRSSPLPWLPRSATGRRLGRVATWRRGLGWYPGSSRPAVRTSLAVSPSKATDTCGGCWSPARWPSSATHKSTAH